MAVGSVSRMPRQDAHDPRFNQLWRRSTITAWTGRTLIHRLILQPGQSAWTLVYTGPKYREWGFHDIELGWVHWRKYRDIVLGGDE